MNDLAACGEVSNNRLLYRRKRRGIDRYKKIKIAHPESNSLDSFQEDAMLISAQPLTPAAFEPFGQVFTAPEKPGLRDDIVMLSNLRQAAHPSIIVARVEPSSLPLTATVMERHRFSSQSFVPMNVSRYVVIVAPGMGDGSPDISKVRAFIAESGQGISYNPNTWHHGVTVLDQPADFAVFMWNDGTADDTEFLKLKESFEVREPA
ncbi:MAG: ureidoglycolate lyase [SAR324 cluster bacterium]|nr:ureidoglycolate lyase [SAR324 cluster bacterium]